MASLEAQSAVAADTTAVAERTYDVTTSVPVASQAIGVQGEVNIQRALRRQSQRLISWEIPSWWQTCQRGLGMPPC